MYCTSDTGDHWVPEYMHIMSVFVKIRKPLGFQIYSTDIYRVKVTLGFSSFISREFIRNGRTIGFRPYYIIVSIFLEIETTGLLLHLILINPEKEIRVSRFTVPLSIWEQEYKWISWWFLMDDNRYIFFFIEKGRAFQIRCMYTNLIEH